MKTSTKTNTMKTSKTSNGVKKTVKVRWRSLSPRVVGVSDLGFEPFFADAKYVMRKGIMMELSVFPKRLEKLQGCKLPEESWEWMSKASFQLRSFPNDTVFLHRRGYREAIRVCRLIGNLPTDENWKAIDLATLDIFKLKNTCEFILLPLK
jgi:hypothetical protein